MDRGADAADWLALQVADEEAAQKRLGLGKAVGNPQLRSSGIARGDHSRRATVRVHVRGWCYRVGTGLTLLLKQVHHADQAVSSGRRDRVERDSSRFDSALKREKGPPTASW